MQPTSTPCSPLLAPTPDVRLDWPGARRLEYKRWADTVQSAISKLSTEEQKRIWGATAAEAYKL
jgi:hypothetical protein